MKIAEVKSRTVAVKATKQIEVVHRATSGRREENHVPEEEKHQSEYFDDFFDYEQESLYAMKPSRELANSLGMEMKEESFANKDLSADEAKIDSFVVMEESSGSSFLTMEEHSEEYSNTSASTKGYVFIRCEHIKENGERCKRQAPKEHTICSVHQKFLSKNKS